MSDRLAWTIEPQGERTTVKLTGAVDEDADLAALAADLKGRAGVCLDMSEINRINSCGVREWVNFMRGLSLTGPIELEKCSPVVVLQINMISNFAGPARVLSVQAPFVCEECGAEDNVLLDVAAGAIPPLQAVNCPKCGTQMVFDDVEDVYFAFLR